MKVSVHTCDVSQGESFIVIDPKGNCKTDSESCQDRFSRIPEGLEVSTHPPPSKKIAQTEAFLARDI